MPIHDWTRAISGTFHDFHHEWISTIKRALNSGMLPPEYYAMAEQIAGGLGLDVLTLGAVGNDNPSRSNESEGGIALATAPPRVRFTARAENGAYSRKRSRVAIRHRSGDDVIAMIEIVSPGNKSS